MIPCGHLKTRTLWLASFLLVTWGSLSRGSVEPQLFFGLDKIEHLGAYAWLAFLQTLFSAPRTRLPHAVALVCWGGLMEILQTIVPMRDASIADLAANTCGVVIGYGIARALSSRHDNVEETDFQETAP